MDTNNNIDTSVDPYFEDVKPTNKASVSFDYAIWFYRIIKYWYLFIISISVCLGIAYIKNKAWVPFYITQAMMMLESKNSSIVSGAVPVATLLRSAKNQQFVLGSWGLAERTVKSLPIRMHIDYFVQTRFKSTSLYSKTPIRISIIELQPVAYQHIYKIEYIDDLKCHIYYKLDEKSEKLDFSITVPFGQVYTDSTFTVRLEKTKYFTKFDTFDFRFLSDNDLIGMYHGRVSSNDSELDGAAMAISMTGTDPDRDLEYLTVLLSEFQKNNLTLKNQQADSTIAFIDRQLIIINDSLESSRRTLDEFQKETGVYNVTSTNLRSEIDAADKIRDALAIKEQALLSVSERISEAILGNTELIEPEILGVTEGKLSQAIRKYNDVIKKAKYLGPKNPLYQKTIEELNSDRTAILEELQILQTFLQDDKDDFVKTYELLDLKVNNLPPQERVFTTLQRTYRINETYHQYLTQKKYEAQIQKASNTPDNYIWEEPRLIAGPINGGTIRSNYTYYLMIGLILPLIFVVLKEEVLNFTIATKEECEKISGLSVIGAIENTGKKANKGPVLVKNYPKSSFAESFRNIRIRVEYLAKRESKFSVLVTSAEPGDGKTFIAINIASAYQIMGKKVVIVDLDLRRPSVAKTLQLDVNKGVSNYLIGQVELEEIIVSSPDYGFDIISAGTLPPNPSELIKTEKTAELLNTLKQMYDYVIVDCSPVGLVSDAYILGRTVDVTLFVVRRAKTNKSFFKSVINQLRIDGIDNVSLIFNDVKGREGFYGTSRYYGDKTYYLKKNSYYHDDYFEN